MKGGKRFTNCVIQLRCDPGITSEAGVVRYCRATFFTYAISYTSDIVAAIVADIVGCIK
jgi:hypothetical protein